MHARSLFSLLIIASLWLSNAHADGPALGSPAPDFKLQDQGGAWRELKSYRGNWVVLYFYAQDRLPSSTDSARDFSDQAAAFRDAGATIVGISVDDVESHKKFAARTELPFKLLADPTKQTTRAYGMLKTYLGGMELAKRDTFLIDPEGRVVKHYADAEPKGHAVMVLNELKALKK
jgi:peroxiredoxin Q/BCP